MLPLAAVQLPREMICQRVWAKWLFVKSGAACLHEEKDLLRPSACEHLQKPHFRSCSRFPTRKTTAFEYGGDCHFL